MNMVKWGDGPDLIAGEMVARPGKGVVAGTRAVL